MRTYYPEIEPSRTGFLQVSDIHSIYWEESGNSQGTPILFLHGGPGSPTEPNHRRFFDPSHYRIFLFDQRGCGKSKPSSSLEQNTTWDLVNDIEKLRDFFHIEKWIVFGGSWGSTLALTYAIKHPEHVAGLILRSAFFCRQKELKWFYGRGGAHRLFPEEWENFISPIPKEEQDDLIKAYYQRLILPTLEERKKAAIAWGRWEFIASKLEFDPKIFEHININDYIYIIDAVSRIECHYFFHRGFFESDNWILENILSIQHIPTTLVHGRYDILCPVENAWELHKIWKNMKLEIIPSAGHSASEPAILSALIDAADQFKSLSIIASPR